MGYYTNTEVVKIFLDKKYFEDVYNKMCELNDHHDLKRGGSFGRNNDNVEGERYPRDKWFSWMPYNYPEILSDMNAILSELGFDTEYDKDGNLVGLSYSDKTGNEDYFLQCFAGYVTDGSYIEFKGEESDDYYRFLFENGKMIMQRGIVSINYEDGEVYEFGKMNHSDTASKIWLDKWRAEKEAEKNLSLENY